MHAIAHTGYSTTKVCNKHRQYEYDPPYQPSSSPPHRITKRICSYVLLNMLIIMMDCLQLK